MCVNVRPREKEESGSRRLDFLGLAAILSSKPDFRGVKVNCR